MQERASSRVDLYVFDIVSPAFHANPIPTLDRMRAEAPVVRMKLPIVGRTFLAVTHDKRGLFAYQGGHSRRSWRGGGFAV
ncbi:hypothetical protein EN859_034685 [Mesorhizobium sp. M00.F.Ca.ET.216.01.1.1]|nr:hypothetical protein EN859_034685 [Mesorhizobium sp. M00.F.Ca.ET.216.01.1.1]TJW02537.1 MAG: hypothetical protein E5W82_33780 [Mesorhizobium sp.]TJW40647.1 MAG: hypothetical protein E5W83_27990 [Mesorhizobium sp.]